MAILMAQPAASSLEERWGTVELVLPGDIELEAVAVQAAGAVAAQAGFPPERVEDVKTAVGEAFINAVEHGNRGRADRQVTLRFHRQGNTLRVDVFDCGKGFDLNRLEAPHLRPKIEGRESRRGWGLFLMRHLADHLEVSRCTSGGSCVSLTIVSRPSSLDR